MAHIVVDRRKNDKGKNSVNRQKFLRRVKGQVADAVKDIINDGSIKDIVDTKDKKINIPGKGLDQPTFQHDTSGGMSERVLPGNDKYVQGDRVDRPESGEGEGGSQASPDGEGQDSFDFHLSKEEFLDMFFEDLQLPDLTKKNIKEIEDFAWKRAGFSSDGNPSRLNIMRSMKQSKGRRFALRSKKKRKLRELEAELKAINSDIEQLQSNGSDYTIEQTRKKEIEAAIIIVKRKIKAVPFVDETDLRYNRWDKTPIPKTQAVMFCIMDVSGSMQEWEKEMSKRFFILLYLFLFRNYEKVEIVFIRHHTSAKEVDEEEFFHSKESGGTLISPALELMKTIIDERYSPAEWNIFGCQASDGDNWNDDSNLSQELMLKEILPLCQYFAYVEITKNTERESDIWPYYTTVKDQCPNFEMTKIFNAESIYPVFRKLFETRD